uniref:CD82 antigen n=1 Tax=Centroberyx gerrardi TaxID=166262 RepID=UPI003AAAF0B2
MKLEEKIQVLKFCSAVFNTIFLILGLSVCGCAVWILFDKGNLLSALSSEELRTVAAGLLVIGAVVVAVSAVGCLGAQGENRFFLLMYMAFLIVLVLGQLFVMLVLLIHRGKIEDGVAAAVQQIISSYGGSSGAQDRLLDNVQRYGECCGMAGPGDWLENSFIQEVNLTNPTVLPCSCFNSSWCPELPGFNTSLFGRGNDSYEEGCEKKISDWLEENALTIVGMDVSLMLIQVVQFVVVVYLYQAVGRKVSLKGSGPLITPVQNQDQDQNLDYDLEYGEQNQGFIGLDDGYIDPAHPDYHHDNQNHIYLEPNQGYQ